MDNIKHEQADVCSQIDQLKSDYQNQKSIYDNLVHELSLFSCQFRDSRKWVYESQFKWV